MTRKERIAKIRSRIDTPIESSPEAFALVNGKVKVGAGLDFIVFETKQNGESNVRSQVQGDGNPGFTFGSSGSELRAGPTLEVDTPQKDVSWDGKAMNPLHDHLAPNIVNYYRPMIPNLGKLPGAMKAVNKLL